MQWLGLFAVVVAAIGISWKLRRKRDLWIQELGSSAKTIAEDAEQLRCKWEQASRDWNRKLQSAIMAIDARTQLLGTRGLTLFQIDERVEYRKRTVKTLLDPVSQLSFSVKTEEKVGSVGAQTDPASFKAFFKEKHKRKARFELPSSEIRQLAEAYSGRT